MINNIYKSALITGAGDGIGYETLKRFLKEKIIVYALDKNVKKLKILQKKFKFNIHHLENPCLYPKAIKNKIEPQTLQLELAGIEIAFQRIRVSMNTFDLSTQDLYEKLMETYEQNRTAEMPAVTYNKANIPNIMSNLDWSSEDTILNRLNELVDSFGASGENNGVLNYFDI